MQLNDKLTNIILAIVAAMLLVLCIASVMRSSS
jgi:sensor domain CHASE-containing protein